MALKNKVSEIFAEIANLLEIQGANPFRVRAYRNCARSILDVDQDLQQMVLNGADLTQLPGVGKDLATQIIEISKTGTSGKLEELKKAFPEGITELLKVQGLGPKRVKQLYEELKIQNLDQLADAAKSGKIKLLKGFGKKIEQLTLQETTSPAQSSKRFLVSEAKRCADELLEYLKPADGIRHLVAAGSLRRSRETVGDLDILVTAEQPEKVMERFVAFPGVKKVLAKGSTRSAIVLENQLQVDLRVVDQASYGAALHYFTGSQAHNIVIRRMGQQKGLKVNEYGVFKGKKKIAGDTEESVFKAVGLPFISPELRENRGEVEQALKGKLPHLVQANDLLGDLHSHTTATDGHYSMLEMAKAAQSRGLKYLAITDHSKRLAMTKGLDEKRLLKQMDEIDKANKQFKGFSLLKGIEVDILEDGSLDLSDEVLGRLDLVVGAVHSLFKLPREKQTERILRAMDHKYFTLLAHPSGRLILKRDGYDVDLERIIRHAAQRGCYMELNAQPDRLDLSDDLCRLAKKEGVLISINSDSHYTREFDQLAFGVGQARRGWLEKKDVLNTRSLEELRPLLKATMG